MYVHAIKSKADISEIFSKGTRFNSKNLSIIVLNNGNSAEQRDPRGRVVFIAGKRSGSAVERNRAKRVLRAVASEIGLPLAGHDIALVATRHTGSADHAEVVSSLSRLLDKAHLR